MVGALTNVTKHSEDILQKGDKGNEVLSPRFGWAFENPSLASVRILRSLWPL
jgi:hypothetical protein